MHPSDVDHLIAVCVGRVVHAGLQPARVLLGIPAYQALLTRDGLAPRSIGQTASTTLRAFVLNFDLPVDCIRTVPTDEALCKFVVMPRGLA